MAHHDAGAMAAIGFFIEIDANCPAARRVHFQRSMSRRAHLWLRIIGLAMIVGAQMLPRGFAHTRAAMAQVQTQDAPQVVSQLGSLR